MTESGAGTSRSRPKNLLLRAIPDAAFERLYPSIVVVSIAHKEMIYRQGSPVQFVYFPDGGVVSITAAMADGTLVETATVGIEGMVGVEVCLGDGAIAWGDTMVQIPDGSASRIPADVLRAELGRHDAVSQLLGRYTQTVVAQMMQTGACNALHPVHERCARWLLMSHDRVSSDSFELSHEFLAMMLGVRRPSVTVVAGTLQAAGLIAYRHGRVTIVDRAGLEMAACECYGRFREQLNWLRNLESTLPA